MQNIIQMNIIQFSLIYLLLLIVLAIMKKCKIKQTKLLMIASFRMTVQLMLAGLILTYIFKDPKPIYTILYLCAMTLFSIYRVLSKNKNLNKRFKIYVSLSLSFSSLLIIFFFIGIVMKTNVFNPQYTIPISGMIFGNAMTGVSLALKTFSEEIKNQSTKIEILLNFGVTPQKILLPFVNNALETALLPTMNSMLSMGIIALPGMMTGQILSGTLPLTAILYQIAIVISICAVVCLSVFCSLYFGYKSLYNEKNQIMF